MSLYGNFPDEQIFWRKKYQDVVNIYELINRFSLTKLSFEWKGQQRLGGTWCLVRKGSYLDWKIEGKKQFLTMTFFCLLFYIFNDVLVKMK